MKFLILFLTYISVSLADGATKGFSVINKSGRKILITVSSNDSLYRVSIGNNNSMVVRGNPEEDRRIEVMCTAESRANHDTSFWIIYAVYPDGNIAKTYFDDPIIVPKLDVLEDEVEVFIGSQNYVFHLDIQ